jgi:hypothetical protein
MTCAAFTARVPKKLSAIDAVWLPSIRHRALITAPESAPVQQLIDAVMAAGHRAPLPGRSCPGTGGPGDQGFRTVNVTVVATEGRQGR